MKSNNIKVVCIRGISKNLSLLCLVGDVLELEENTGGITLKGISGYSKGTDFKISAKKLAKRFVLKEQA